MTDRRPPGGDDPAPDAGREADARAVDDGEPRWRAALAAVLLLVAGAALGIVADRLWLTGTPAVEAAPLTVDALAQSLDLAPDERTRVRRLLDSLEVEVAEAARSGPDSLRTVARRARARLEGALPRHARPDFRRWMQSQHRRMMEEMHGRGGRMHPDGTGPMHRDGTGRMHPDGMAPMHRDGGGTMRPDTPPRRR